MHKMCYDEVLASVRSWEVGYLGRYMVISRDLLGVYWSCYAQFDMGFFAIFIFALNNEQCDCNATISLPH